MISTTWKQLSRFTAVLALSLICAQSLAVSHSHDLVDDAVCAICFASSDGALLNTAIDLPPPVARPLVEALTEIVDAGTCPSFTQHSRAPPAA